MSDDDWFEKRDDDSDDGWMFTPPAAPVRMRGKRTVAAPRAGHVRMREAERELNWSRKRILRQIKDGMPCVKFKDHIYLDIAACLRWVEEYEPEGKPASIPQWRDDDPRFIEHVARIKIAAIKAGLKSGALIPIPDGFEKFIDGCAKFRAAMLVIPKTFPPADFEDMDTLRPKIKSAIDDALTYLQFGFAASADKFVMPEPGNRVDDPDEPVNFAPGFAKSDVRYQGHAQKAELANKRLTDLIMTTVEYPLAKAEHDAELAKAVALTRAIPDAAGSLESLNWLVRLALGAADTIDDDSTGGEVVLEDVNGIPGYTRHNEDESDDDT